MTYPNPIRQNTRARLNPDDVPWTREDAPCLLR